MPAAPAAVAELLARGQVARTHVEAWLTMPDGRGRVPLDVVSLSGDTDLDRVWRTELVAEVVGQRGAPLGRDLMVPQGQVLTARKGVEDPDGRVWWATQGSCRVLSSQQVDDGPWLVKARSREYHLQASAFPLPREVAFGLAVTTVKALVAECFPNVPMVVHPAVTNVPVAPKTYDAQPGSRWQAIEDASIAAGAQLWCGPGGGFVLAPAPRIDGPSDWDVEHERTLVSRTFAASEEDMANVVVVYNSETGRDEGGARVSGFAADWWAGSRTYVGDLGMLALTGSRGTSGNQGLGVLPDFQDIPVMTNADATAAARARLRVLKARMGGTSFDALDQPWGRAGDRVRVLHPDGVTKHLIRRMPISGTDGGPMSPGTEMR